MQFIVTAYDGTDPEAATRRQAARPAHLSSAEQFFKNGTWIFASALLNDEGHMIGSVIACDFPDRRALEEEWLKTEPYVIGDVWQDIRINRAQFAKHDR